MKIYVASSWRNEYQQLVVSTLRSIGHEVYDFKNPSDKDHGFSWSEIDPNWKNWDVKQFVSALEQTPAERGFGLDMAALRWCDACVCVLPSGKDAHLEVGWAAGAGKKTAILLLDRADGGRGWEPGLMYKMCDLVTGELSAVIEWLDAVGRSS